MRLRPLVRHALAALVLAIFALVQLAAIPRDAPTADEPTHVTRGLSWIWTGDARLSYAHPPLANVLEALPSAGARPVEDFTSLPGWDAADTSAVSRQYFGAHYETARSQLMRGRAVVVALAVLLGLYLYAFALRFGGVAALATLAVYACSPAILAHGHLATTDLPVTLIATMTIGECVAWLERPGYVRLVTLALALACALATKFNAVFLPAVVVVAGAWFAFRRSGRFAGRGTGRAFLRLAIELVFIAAVGAFLLAAVYRFHRVGWSVGRALAEPEPHNWIAKQFDQRLLEDTPLGLLPRWVRLPLPYHYVFGAMTIAAQSEGGHGSWFMGRPESWFLGYFPIMIVVKTPLATLGLLGLAARRFVRRRRLPRGPLALVLAAPAFYLAIACFSHINIGVRHVLPLFPFLALAAGVAAARGLEWARRARWGKPVALGLAAALVAECAFAFPHYLAHFSWAIGGPAVGHHISIVGEDWGQDTIDVAAFIRERHLLPLHYDPYGIASQEMRRDGVQYVPFHCKDDVPPGAWIAVHATERLRRTTPCPPLDDLGPPQIVFAHHIWFWHVPDSKRAR